MSWVYRKQITIPHTNVSGGTDLLNFPLLVSLTDSALKTAGNGGNVQNSNGYDIVFTDTYNILLDFEVETYVAATGQLIAWVRIPLLSASVDTVIYCYYDNTAITSSQANPAGVWDGNFLGVYHLGNGTTLSALDSTANARNGTITGATATSGQIDGGANFNGTSNTMSFPTTGLPTLGPWTLSAWVDVAQTPTQFGAAIGLGTGTTSVELCYRGSGAFCLIANGGSGAAVTNPSNLVVGTRYKLEGVYDGATLTLYVNGASVGVAALSNYAITYGTAHIAQLDGGDFFNGWEDEVRISNTNRSAGWIATTYSNEQTPSAWCTVGLATLYTSITESVTLTESVSLASSLSLSDQLALSESASSTLLPGGSVMNLVGRDYFLLTGR